MLVLSLASGRPAPHNDPFIRLREPWARVSSDKGGRRAPVPLLGIIPNLFIRINKHIFLYEKNHSYYMPCVIAYHGVCANPKTQ